MNQTDNYQLCQWDEDDRILRADFNSDNQKTDAAIAANAAAVAAEAGARASAVAALTEALGQKGNCQIETFTYTGNGTFGEENPTVINFSRMPVMFVITGEKTLVIGGGGDSKASAILQSTYMTSTTYISDLPLTWSGNQLRTYNNSYASDQLNRANVVYRVFALYRNDG